MNIAVTGASGHIGANLTRRLIADGNKVKVLLHKDKRAIKGLPLEIINGSLNDFRSIEELGKNADVVFHLAARISIGQNNYETVYNTNVEGTKNIVKTCRKLGVPKFIHFSSIHTLDPNPFDQPLDETRPLIENSGLVYERTKAECEKWITEQNSDNFHVVVLNPTAVLGPNDFKPSFMGQFIIKLYKGTIPALVPGGYDWVDVRDVVDAAVNAIEKATPGERYILSGGWKSFREIAKMFAQITGKKINLPVLPFSIVRLGLPFIHLYSKIKKEPDLFTAESLKIVKSANRNIINAKSRKQLGFKPKPLNETLTDSLKWYKENGFI